MNTTPFNLAFACYFLALAAHAGAYLFSKPKWRVAGFAALAAAWIFQTLFLALRWRVSGHAPLSNQYESLASMSWAVTLLFFLFQRMEPGAWFAPTVAVLGIGLMGLCSLLDASMAPLVPALQSNWLLLHVSVIMLAYAALALSFAASVFHLAACGEKAPEERSRAVDRFNERSMSLGYLLLAAGIILGAVWANEAWGSYWSWDPKETWSLVTWLVYTIAVHLRRTHGWEGRRMAWLSVTGFMFVLFTYFGVNYLMTGLHSYAK